MVRFIQRTAALIRLNYSSNRLVSDQNIVDWDVDELDEETNETHDQKANALTTRKERAKVELSESIEATKRLQPQTSLATTYRSTSNGREFFSVGLGALLDEMNRVLGELSQGFDENLVESFLISHVLFL